MSNSADAAILRAAYGPASVPTGDPTDEDYTWTEEAAPLEALEEQPTEQDRRLAALEAGLRRLAALDADLRALQADVRHLQTIAHRLLNPGCED